MGDDGHCQQIAPERDIRCDVHEECRAQAAKAVRQAAVMRATASHIGQRAWRSFGRMNSDGPNPLRINSTHRLNHQPPGMEAVDIDTHGHMRFSYDEIAGYDETSQNVDPDDVDRLLGFMDDAGLDQMWVSGMMGETFNSEEYQSDVEALVAKYGGKEELEHMRDTLILEASRMSIPDGQDEPRLVPFVAGFFLESERTPEYVCDRLAEGFAGIGELIVHGHTGNTDGTNDILQQVYQAAAQYGVPVLVHWDIGGVEYDEDFCGSDESCDCDEESFLDYARIRRQENLAELIAVIEANPETIFILAHCGAGPGGWSDDPCDGSQLGNPSQLDAVTSGEYGAALESLALDYENIWFDVSGIPGEIEEVQSIIFSMIERRSDRFLFGYDTDDEALQRTLASNIIQEHQGLLSELDNLGIRDEVMSANPTYIAMQRTTSTDGPCEVGEDDVDDLGWVPWGPVPLQWFDRFDDANKLEPFGPDDFIMSTW